MRPPTEWLADATSSPRRACPLQPSSRPPHYAATDDAYQGISRVYSTRYERSLFYAGTLTGQRGGPYDYVGQFFPYKVSDPYGMNVLPENLGNYEPEAYSQHPARTAQDIVARRRRIRCSPMPTRPSSSTPSMTSMH